MCQAPREMESFLDHIDIHTPQGEVVLKAHSPPPLLPLFVGGLATSGDDEYGKFYLDAAASEAV